MASPNAPVRHEKPDAILTNTGEVNDDPNLGAQDLAVEASDDPNLKRTPDGTILVPQSTDDPDEPLNWTFARKHAALVVLGLGSFFVKFTATILAPGAIGLAKQFGVTSTQGTYVASAASVVPAIAPFFWIPLSRRYGRRPLLMVGSVIAIIFGIVVGQASTYAQALVGRIVMAFGASSAICIGPAAISDMFFLHEKGTRMGINTFLLVCAPYLGGVAGGSVQYNTHLGWRWAMYISSLIYVFMLIAQFLLGQYVQEPSQLLADMVMQYPRQSSTDPSPKMPPKGGSQPSPAASDSARQTGKTRGATSSAAHSPFLPTRAVFLPSLWFGISAMTEVANTAGFPLSFGPESRWRFNTRQIGFCSFSGLVGAIVGEMFAGPLCDLVVKYDMKRGHTWRPERLLPLTLPGLVMISAGLLLYGLELTCPTNSSWVAALAGIAIFTAGQEIMLTVIMTYLTDCYPGQAAEISVCFQCCLNLMAYHPPFYTPYWVKGPGGPKIPYIVYAVLPVVFAPVGGGLLIWKGAEIRAREPWFKL